VIQKWFTHFPFASFPDARETWKAEIVIALIKPQFEAGKKDVSRGDGVIRDPAIHRQVLLDILNFAQQQGFRIHGLIKSPLLGPKGNVEFLVWLDQAHPESDRGASVQEIADWVERAL
jgi:23S rRNA (cytidine1920-2'-O)/16S rRNA (cytidine1409-2'-O)-methyltransferase